MPSAGRASIPAATSVKRARSRRQASAAAAPFKSVPADAAVGEVLLFLSVLVAVTMTPAYGTPSSSATICRTRVLTPWPISVAPVLTMTEPSWYTFTSAFAWFIVRRVNEMPNFTADIAIVVNNAALVQEKPFEAITDNGRDSALQALSQCEQFRYALGSAMGQSDLRLNPPLRILVFHDAKDMAAAGCEAGIHMGRDHLMACSVASGQLPAAMVKELTERLLRGNFSGIPPATEKALETFFSTVESNAVHVTWGAPPPLAERTRDWALLHRLITQPDMSGRAHIYLHNVAMGMDSKGAIRSLGEDPAKFNAEVDRDTVSLAQDILRRSRCDS